MGDITEPLINVDHVDTDSAIQEKSRNETAITPEVHAFYIARATTMKEKIDHLGAETSQRQQRMSLLNGLIAEINNLTDKNNHVDISENFQVQEQLRVARELGVKIIENKVKFDAVERDRLIENLHLALDGWDKENRNQTQQMEIYIKELDRVMMFLKEVQKGEHQARRSAIAGIKGG